MSVELNPTVHDAGQDHPPLYRNLTTSLQQMAMKMETLLYTASTAPSLPRRQEVQFVPSDLLHSVHIIQEQMQNHVNTKRCVHVDASSVAEASMAKVYRNGAYE
eukprot:m.1644950 g.1644950  ORF g.1644950 m.1644950 type:complete len:104 (+) comp64996_c0_seq1:432-743(+)